MAANEVYPVWDGHLVVAASHPTTPASGDPIRYGVMTGVALVDEGSRCLAATDVVADFGMGVWDLYVDDNEGTGVAVGNTIYYHDTATGDPATSLNNSPTGMNAVFGIALEAVGANATTKIKVLHIPLGATMTLGANAVTTGMITDANVTSAKLEAPLTHYVDKKLTSAQVKALKGTPIQLVAAPGADKAVVPEAIVVEVDYGGSNAFTETGDDLSIGYSGGAEIMEIESTGLIDQTNDEWRYITFEHAETFVPEENKAVVITNLDDEIAGNAAGDNTVQVRLYYRIVPTDSFIA